MVFYLVLVNVVLVVGVIEGLLQIGVFDWFIGCCVLVFVFLIVYLFVDIVVYIGVVGIKIDSVGLFQCIQCFNGCCQFYLVIGCFVFVIVQFFDMFVEL